MLNLPPITLRLRSFKLIDRVALAFLLLCAILFGTACGLLFVYVGDLPEIRALETYRPNVVTEIYADDGQLVGSFALQRRILMTYEQCPKVLYNAVTAIEDQHFEQHWGIDFPRIFTAALRHLTRGRRAGGASTITMQLAGNLFLDRSDISFRRKAEETLLALQIERRYSKPQIFTMYANQVYLAHGDYGFAAASQFYFGKPVTDLTLPEAALLAGMINGPKYSPLLNPEAALARRNLVLHRLEEEGKITPAEEAAAVKSRLGLHVQYPRNDLAPYFFEELRKYLEATYGTAAVHERGLRIYTTLNVHMQQVANQALRDGLHAYERRHGWKGNLPNVLRDNLGRLDTYEDEDWRHAIEKGSYVTGLVLSVGDRDTVIKIGPYRAILSPSDFAWTGRRARYCRSTTRPAKSKPWLVVIVLKIPNSTGQPRRSGRSAALSRFMCTRTLWRRARRPLTRLWICRTPPSAADSLTHRTITMKNLRARSRCGVRWPARATSRP